MWVIAGSAALLLWAGLYLGSYSGGFQGDVFNEEANYKPPGPTGPVDPIVASKKRGHGVFVANCAQCHQVTGLGQAGQFPPLVASEWVVGDAPKRLPLILLHGIQGTIHVKGEVYNNQMPAWAGVLSDKQISDVLTYVRGELGGNSRRANPRSALIKADRDLTIKHEDSYTEAELQKDSARPHRGRYAGGRARHGPWRALRSQRDQPAHDRARCGQAAGRSGGARDRPRHRARELDKNTPSLYH